MLSNYRATSPAFLVSLEFGPQGVSLLRTLKIQKDRWSGHSKMRGLTDTGATSKPRPLLFQLINGFLFLINLIPEAGQLPVMGLTVILHL